MSTNGQQIGQTVVGLLHGVGGALANAYTGGATQPIVGQLGQAWQGAGLLPSGAPLPASTPMLLPGQAPPGVFTPPPAIGAPPPGTAAATWTLQELAAARAFGLLPAGPWTPAAAWAQLLKAPRDTWRMVARALRRLPIRPGGGQALDEATAQRAALAIVRAGGGPADADAAVLWLEGRAEAAGAFAERKPRGPQARDPGPGFLRRYQGW